MRHTLSFPLLVLAAACGGGGGMPVTVHAPAGELHGEAIALPGGARALGIVYATATGDAPAVAAPPATAPVDATSFGTACPGTSTSRPTGDDCLRLSVWTPDVAPATPAPVLVYVPAGGVDLAAPTYDGFAYAHIGGVLVTVQHRADPAGLAATGAGLARTDAALHDVALALHWTRANAAAFGGDATQPVVFGSGGGAQLVCAALAAGRLGDVRVVLESGTCLDAPAGVVPSLPRAPADVFADATFALPPLVAGWNADEPSAVACGARHLAAAWDARGAHAWLYADEMGSDRGPGAELPFVFGNAPAGRAFTDIESATVYAVMTTWVDFARDGDAASPVTDWPRWTRAMPSRATFGAALASVPDATCP